MREMVRAEGTRCSCLSLACSARRRRVDHAPTTRSDPWKSFFCNCRQSAAPFRQPPSQSASRSGRYASSELFRTRKTSPRHPRTICRTVPRLRPVRRTICLIGTPSVARAMTVALASSRRRYPSYCSRSADVEVWIDRRRADRPPDLPHRFADRVEERAAGVLHQMPTIGDLGGVRQCLRNRFAIGTAAVSRDDLDRWAQRQPGLK